MADVQRDDRVGLVGFGGRGAGLARFWQGMPGARLAAVADLIPELLDKARVSCGDIACYPDHQRMLADADLDVLTIATTSLYHAAITRDACAQDIRGIYCEKPMACSLANADAMIADCRASGMVLRRIADGPVALCSGRSFRHSRQPLSRHDRVTRRRDRTGRLLRP